MAQLGAARLGMAGQGTAWRGLAWLGSARQAGHGGDRPGLAWHGAAWPGVAWQGFFTRAGNTMAFDIKRADGRSNQQVLIDSVAGAEPGTLFTYDQLSRILGFDDKRRTQSVVVSAQRRLLKEFCRTMMNVRGEGYRIAEAKEHMMLAHDCKRRSDVQLRKGLHILRHVKWEEMDEETRKAHEGTLMVTEALYSMQAAQDKRLAKIEKAIKQAGLV